MSTSRRKGAPANHQSDTPDLTLLTDIASLKSDVSILKALTLGLLLVFTGGVGTAILWTHNMVTNGAKDIDKAVNDGLKRIDDATRQSLTWTKLTKQDGIRNYDDTQYSEAQYAIDSFGVVHLRGMVSSDEAFDSSKPQKLLFSLPDAARPEKTIEVLVNCGSKNGPVSVEHYPCVIAVRDGSVFLRRGKLPGHISLDSVLYQGPARTAPIPPVRK